MKNSIYKALKISAIFGIGFLFCTDELYANTCEYSDKINQCISEQSKDPRGLPFLCPASADNTDFIAYQVVLDGEFSRLDDEIEVYLDTLEKNKLQFYSGGKTYLDGYDEISQKLGVYGEYWKKYTRLCSVENPSGVVQKTLACLPKGSTVSTLASFTKQNECQRLIETKLLIYRNVADNILYLNKAYSIATRKTSYLGRQVDTYSSLIEKFVYNIGMIYRFNKKYQNRNPDGYK